MAFRTLDQPGDTKFVSLAVYPANRGLGRRLHLSIGRDLAEEIGIRVGDRLEAMIGEDGTGDAGTLVFKKAKKGGPGCLLYANGSKRRASSLGADLPAGATGCDELRAAVRCTWSWYPEERMLNVKLPQGFRGSAP